MSGIAKKKNLAQVVAVDVAERKSVEVTNN